MNNLTTSVFMPVYPHPMNTVVRQNGLTVQPNPVAQIAGTLVIASALSIGSNLVDVQNGGMTLPEAVANGAVKGLAATVILGAAPRNTTTEIMITAGVLATAGYLVDSAMNTSRGTPCALPEKTAV